MHSGNFGFLFIALINLHFPVLIIPHNKSRQQYQIPFQSCGNLGIKMGGHHSLPQHVDDYYNVLHD